MDRSRIWLGGALLAALVGCEGDEPASHAGPAGSGGSGGGGARTTSVDARGTIALGQTSMLFGGTVSESSDLTFDWSADTLSVSLYAELDGGAADDVVFVTFLEGPGGNDLFRAGADIDAYLGLGRPLRPGLFPGSGSLLLPEADGDVVASGTYTFRLGSTRPLAKLWVVHRTGPMPASGTLDLDLYFVEGSGLTSADTGTTLAPAIDEMFKIFRQAGIDRGVVRGIDLAGADAAEFVAPRVDLTPTGPMRRLVTRAAGAPTSYNIFFTRTLTGDDPGSMTLGISMGIPAALAIQGTIGSGSIVGVEGHRRADGTLDLSELGSTMAHETAHSMGLFHTTEKDGKKHDLISDTPECPIGNDTNGDGLSPEECMTLDASNFLFWTGTGNRGLSAGQKEILLRSPIVQGR